MKKDIENYYVPCSKLVNIINETKDQPQNELHPAETLEFNKDGKMFRYGSFAVAPFKNSTDSKVSEIVTTCQLLLEDINDGVISDVTKEFQLKPFNLTYFDFAIANMVYSIEKADYKSFSLSDLVKLFAGTNDASHYPQFKNDVFDEIEKLRRIYCNIRINV